MRTPTFTLCRECGYDKMLRVLMGSLACCRGQDGRCDTHTGSGGATKEHPQLHKSPEQILTILALIAVKPDRISAMLIETLQGPKWKILFPAVGIKFTQHMVEKRQRNKGDPFMLLWDANTAQRL